MEGSTLFLHDGVLVQNLGTADTAKQRLIFSRGWVICAIRKVEQNILHEDFNMSEMNKPWHLVLFVHHYALKDQSFLLIMNWPITKTSRGLDRIA